jgi:hypothetical protein
MRGRLNTEPKKLLLFKTPDLEPTAYQSRMPFLPPSLYLIRAQGNLFECENECDTGGNYLSRQTLAHRETIHMPPSISVKNPVYHPDA